jgi:hypothetical protein
MRVNEGVGVWIEESLKSSCRKGVNPVPVEI